MTDHKTGTREEWLAARLELRKEEKELTRRSDALARRRQLSQKPRTQQGRWVLQALAAAPVLCALLLAVNPRSARAEQSAPPPPGTKITMQNWQQYKDFMPDGLAHLFQGDLFWKLPPDAEIDIGPTVNIPLPPGYVEATEKYGGQTQVGHLPNAQLDVR